MNEDDYWALREDGDDDDVSRRGAERRGSGASGAGVARCRGGSLVALARGRARRAASRSSPRR